MPPAVGVEEDLVVRLRSGAGRDLPRLPDRDPLHRLDRDEGGREARVEPLRPAHVRAEAWDEPEGPDLEGPAEALVRLAQPVDLRDHLVARRRIEAADG